MAFDECVLNDRRAGCRVLPSAVPLLRQPAMSREDTEIVYSWNFVDT